MYNKNRNGIKAIDIDQYKDEYLDLSYEQAIKKRVELMTMLKPLHTTLDVIIDLIPTKNGTYKVVNRSTFVKQHKML